MHGIYTPNAVATHHLFNPLQCSLYPKGDIK